MDGQVGNNVELRERAGSSEPCSTRANPFDDADTDVPSRKRRRTSLRGASVGSSTSSHSEQPTSTDEASLGTDSATMKDDTEPATPQTPEPKPTAASSLTPKSSRVTINVRTPSRALETIPSSPRISEKEAEADTTSDMALDDDVKISVEETEVEMTNTSTPDPSLAAAVSRSETGSPPVEVITIDEDDGPDYETGHAQVTLLHVPQDPMGDFPFLENHEPLVDAATRLAGFVQTHHAVSKAVSDWIRNYLVFARASDYDTVAETYRRHRGFWNALPDFAYRMTAHREKPTYQRIRIFRREIFGFYHSLAQLTAYFIDFDIKTIRRALAMDESRLPDLASPPYIGALDTLTGKLEITRQSPVNLGDAELRYAEEVTDILMVFQTFHANQGGTMAHLAKLGQLHADLIGRFPKLCDNLGHISGLMANLSRESAQAIKYGARYHVQELEKCKGNLARAYQFFKATSATLSTIIDKHVNYLSPASAGAQLDALTDIYQLCLAADRIVPADVVQQHRQSHLPVADHLVPEAMAYYWRFTMCSRLIQSTQMQLRVMASTAMCSDLVNFWKRHTQAEESTAAFLKYVADFLLHTDLVSYILGPTCHPEITLESSNIVGFLLVSDTYSNEEHTDRMWQTITSTQDPRVSEALLRMSNRIANLYHLEHMIYLCQKLNTLPIEAFGPPIREFCAQVFNVLKVKSQQHMLDIWPYVLCVRLARESSVFGSRSPVAYPELLDFSTQHFKDLLSAGPDLNGRREIFLDCLQDIGRKSRTSLGSLAVMAHMFSVRTMHRDMHALAAENDLASLLVDEMEAAIVAGRTSGFPAVISGAHNTPRKEMIVTMVYGDSSSITTELGRKLWDLLVGSGAACREDRDVGWQILNQQIAMARVQNVNPLMNAFLSTCFGEYLPTLPSEYFCPGTLEFIRINILPLVNDEVNGIVLDEHEGSGQAGIEQLWRLVLSAPSSALAGEAIRTLVNDIYVESRAIRSFPPFRARKVHLAVADRCLRQLSSSASKLRQFSAGTASGGGDAEPTTIVADEQLVREQELLFIRSLAVLRELHQVHQASTRFSVPDLSSLMLESPADMEGDSADLKFQAFDQTAATDVENIAIGRQNTVGALLAALRKATGFPNYRVFFRGQPFLPQESDAAKTLDELQISNGVMLVKREPEAYSPDSPQLLRPGASPLENRIMAHFEELHNYLSMDDKLAREIFHFLVRMPPDHNILRTMMAVDIQFTKLFPVGQPFKCLYTVQALHHCISARQEPQPSEQTIAEWEASYAGGIEEYPALLTRGISLVVAAITDEDVLGKCPSAELQTLLGSHLVQVLVKIIRDPALPESAWEQLDARLLERLVTISSSATRDGSAGNSAEHMQVCLDAIFECCSRSALFWQAFCEDSKAVRLVMDTLLYDVRPTVRQHLATLIRHKVNEASDEQYPGPVPVPADAFATFFWSKSFELIEAAMSDPPGTSELFGVCSTILKRLLGMEPRALPANTLFADLSAKLRSHSTFEDMTRPEVVDAVASGLIELMHDIAMITDSPIDQPQFPSLVFWTFLFPRFKTRPSEAQAGDWGIPKPILCTASRQKLIDIIFKLVDGSPDRMRLLLEDLARLVPYYGAGEDGTEPYNYELVPQFERAKAVRASCGYAGLKNLSNTCYLNSLLTQLFMNVPFRKFMLNTGYNASKRPGQQHDHQHELLFQTRKLFGFMQDSLRRSVDPEDMVLSIKTYEDGQIDIHNQMDVDEFYNLLFDRWESQLEEPEAKKQFRAFYGGQLIQQIKSKECEHISERLELFSAIQCDIKGKTCLQESLQAYVDGEIMEGDNKYLCGTCDKHVNAVKRACLKDMPDNLIFHLKRFDFSVKTMQRSKINDHFAFPTHIDMRPYTIEHLSNPDQDHGEDEFVLVGVLVHSGTAESGHYYSYVRERPRGKEADVWVEFNDDTVSQWDPANMENACFGGVDLRPQFDGSIFDKSWSAYMLFYQRASTLREQEEQADREHQQGPLKVPYPPELNELKGHIRQDNVALLRRHCLYDPTQIGFVIRALEGLGRLPADVHLAALRMMENTAIKMALGHLDQVASRAKDIPDFERLLRKIRDMVLTRPPCCGLYVYDYFNCHPGAFRALLQRNPEAGVRASSGTLLIQAALQVKEHLPGRYGQVLDSVEQDPDRKLVLHGMMHIFQVLFDFFHTNLRAWQEVFGFMADYVRVGPEELAAFLKYHFFHSLLLIITADPALDYGQPFGRMLAAISRKARPPSYDTIIRLVHTAMAAIGNETDVQGRLLTVDEPEDRVVTENPPFLLCDAELKTLNRDWTIDGRNRPNIFLEKLISLDQNFADTAAILTRYMGLGRSFEEKMFRTLKHYIRGEMPSHPTPVCTPFLRVAAKVFCCQARDAVRIAQLIDHVTLQCTRLENTEGLEFYEFQARVFDCEHANTAETNDDITEAGLLRLPKWAPHLLGYYDHTVAREVEQFIKGIVFAPDAEEQFEDWPDQDRIKQARLVCKRELGRQCLVYLKDKYVAERLNAPAPLVSRFEGILRLCHRSFNQEDDGEDPTTTEFYRLYRPVVDTMRSLSVVDMEEDGSAWEEDNDNSSLSPSEQDQMDTLVGMGSGRVVDES